MAKTQTSPKLIPNAFIEFIAVHKTTHMGVLCHNETRSQTKYEKVPIINFKSTQGGANEWPKIMKAGEWTPPLMIIAMNSHSDNEKDYVWWESDFSISLHYLVKTKYQALLSWNCSCPISNQPQHYGTDTISHPLYIRNQGHGPRSVEKGRTRLYCTILLSM